MDTSGATTIAFTLDSPAVRQPVAVRLRGTADRWACTATSGLRSNTALAATARDALAGALAFLPSSAVVALLADVALFGPSADVAVRQRQPA